MAITQFDPNTLTGIIRNDIVGLTSVTGPMNNSTFTVQNQAPPQYDIRHLPDRLRGLGIENALKTINYVITEPVYVQQQDDPAFRDMIKKDLSRMIADEVVKVTKFTQIRDPHTYDIKVIGRVVIMTEDQLNQLIRAIR